MPQRITVYNEADTQKANVSSPTPAKMTSEFAPPPTTPAAGIAAVGRFRKEPAICPTDDDAIVPENKNKNPRTKLDKSSWEYIIKSGVAGGLAGCAVGAFSSGSFYEI